MPDNVKKIRDLNDFDVNTPISKDDFLIVATKEGSVPATNKATIEAIMSAYSAGATDGSDTTTDPDGNTIVDPSKKPGVDIDNGNGGTLRQDTTPATAQNIDQFVQGGAGSGGGSSGLITIEECRDIALSVVDCTDPSVAYRTKKLSIDPEGMIDGGAGSTSGLITIEECRNASNTIVDCADPSVVYRTKKLSLDLGGRAETITAFHEKQIPLGLVNVDNPINNDFQGYMTRRFMRHQCTFNNHGVLGGSELGCGDFMSAAMYNEGINAAVRASPSSALKPINPPDNLISETPDAAIKEFYTMYKRFGAQIDFGTFYIFPEYGPAPRSGTFKGVWCAAFPTYDSTESTSVVSAKAYLSPFYLYSEKHPNGGIDLWMYLGAGSSWIFTSSEQWPVFYSLKLFQSSPGNGWFHWDIDPNGGYRTKDIYLYRIPGQAVGVGGWTTITQLEAYLADTSQTPTFDTSRAAPSTTAGTDPESSPGADPG